MAGADLDEELVAQARAGDATAFDDLVERYRSRVYRLACRLCSWHEQDAEDTLQNALLKAYVHLSDFRGEAKFSSWLAQIAVNECRLLWRRRRREPIWASPDEERAGEQDAAELLADSSEGPERECARREFGQALQECIDELPELYRTVFVMSSVGGLSNEEIAARLGLSLAATKSRLLRARRTLQRRLRSRFCGPGRCDWAVA